MKHFKFLSMMLMAVVAVFAFTACGDDDGGDKGNGNQVTPEQLLGTWYGVDENSSTKINIFVMDFTSVGSGNYTEYKAKADENWNPRQPQSASMTWTLSNGTLNADVNGVTRKGDILSLNGNTIKVRRYLDNGHTDEIVMTRVNSANEVVQIFQQMVAEKTGGQGGDINSSDLVGSWDAVAFTPEGKSRIVLDRKNEDHWPYCLRWVLTKDEITQYAINYNGSEGYRGREEKTLVGKYRIAGNAFIIYNFYEGYHNVKDYENGGGTMSTQPIQATITLTNSGFNITVAGYGTYELQKEEYGVEPEYTIFGTFGTTRIVGSVTDTKTGNVIESWDNTPTINDAKNGKESLKYMEFTFGENKAFKLQQFDEEKRTFTEIMEGTWQMNGNILTVDFGKGSRTVELVSLTENQLVIHTNESVEYKVEETGEKISVVYDEKIYFSRVN